jgi:hypothetical protein
MTQRLDYTNVAPAGVRALGGVYGYITQSGLPTQLINLVYLRLADQRPSLLHRRAFAGLIKEGLAVEAVLVTAWHGQAVWPMRERGALAWAETVTRVAETTIPEAAFLAASSLFSKGTGRPDHRGRVDECV